jgi:hypothetical protein
MEFILQFGRHRNLFLRFASTIVPNVARGATMQHLQPSSANAGADSPKIKPGGAIVLCLVVVGVAAALAPDSALSILSAGAFCLFCVVLLIGTWSVLGLGAVVVGTALDSSNKPPPSSANNAVPQSARSKQASGNVIVWLVLGSAMFFCLIYFAPMLVGSKSRRSPVQPAGEAVWVNGYYRNDGTYVSGHYRSAPDGDPSNNWNNAPSVNPYTGKPGTHHR